MCAFPVRTPPSFRVGFPMDGGSAGAHKKDAPIPVIPGRERENASWCHPSSKRRRPFPFALLHCGKRTAGVTAPARALSSLRAPEGLAADDPDSLKGAKTVLFPFTAVFSYALFYHCYLIIVKCCFVGFHNLPWKFFKIFLRY